MLRTMSEPASPPGAQGPQGAAGAPATGKPPTTISAPGQESLTPLEREVLEEYVELRDNLQSVGQYRLCHALYPGRPLRVTVASLTLARRKAVPTSVQFGNATDACDPGRAARAGAQDQPRVDAAEGQRVQYCTTAGNVRRQWRGPERRTK